jgi:hypothetical protein
VVPGRPGDRDTLAVIGVVHEYDAHGRSCLRCIDCSGEVDRVVNLSAHGLGQQGSAPAISRLSNCTANGRRYSARRTLNRLCQARPCTTKQRHHHHHDHHRHDQQQAGHATRAGTHQRPSQAEQPIAGVNARPQTCINDAVGPQPRADGRAAVRPPPSPPLPPRQPAHRSEPPDHRRPAAPGSHPSSTRPATRAPRPTPLTTDTSRCPAAP